jgi:AbrB family transcriptional regulator (stage V sporulation protein T)
VIAQKGEDRYVRIIGDDEDYEGEIVQTIICQGDAIGAVIVISKDAERLLGEIEMKTAMIAATFLGRQMEG